MHMHMSLYMCVHVGMYVYVCKRVCICMSMHTIACTSPWIFWALRALSLGVLVLGSYKYIHSYVFVHVCAHVYACMCKYARAVGCCGVCSSRVASSLVHSCRLDAGVLRVCVYIYIHMYVCVCAGILLVYMHTRVYMCVYTHMYE